MFTASELEFQNRSALIRPYFNFPPRNNSKAYLSTKYIKFDGDFTIAVF